MSSVGALRSFHFREFFQLWLLAISLSTLMHVRSFWQPHEEGDEIVYLTLAREMNWDLSHYTTRDDPLVSTFPCTIYQGPLFHHPPLFPLVLKFCQSTIGNPTLAGLIFENGAIWLMLYYTWRWMVFQQMPIAWSVLAIAGVTFCPLLLSSSFLLHHDALMGCFMASGLVAFIEALKRPTLPRAMMAGLLLTIGLNLRYNSLIFLPVLIALQIDHLCGSKISGSGADSSPSNAVGSLRNRWLVFGIVAAFVMTLGLQHYYRILATYGSLAPSRFIQLPSDTSQLSPYVRMVLDRKPWKTALHLVLIYPFLLSFLSPWIYRPLWRHLFSGSRDVVFTPIFLYLLAVEFYFSYSQVRYFASITPCLYLGIPCLIRLQSPFHRKILGGLAAVSLMLMFATGFGKTQASPPDSMVIVPAPFFYIPPLRSMMY